MHIGCPACATQFAVPDHALAPRGRILKCSRCGHKWHQDPPDGPIGADDFDADPLEVSEQAASFNPVREPDLDMEFDSPAASTGSMADFDLDMPEPDVPPLVAGSTAPKESVPLDLDLSADPEPIPDMFATKEPGKRGTTGLWLLAVVLVLGGLAGGAYYFQERLVDLWPPAGDILTKVGLRHEKAGAGLELRHAGMPERFVHNDTEVLIVRGIIANVSDRTRPVPTMKLVLLDKTKKAVQEKVQPPPTPLLDPGATSSFRILLERPDPAAVEVNVLFVDQPAATK